MAKKKVNDKAVKKQIELAKQGDKRAQSFVARMAEDSDHPYQKQANEVTEDVTSRDAQKIIEELEG